MPVELLDVVTAAIDGTEPPQETNDGTDPPAPVEGNEPTGNEADDGVVETQGGDPAAPTDGEQPDPEAGPAVGTDANGVARDAQGRFTAKPKEGDDPAAAAAAAAPKKPDDKPPAADAKKPPPDPVNDPIPADAKPRDARRIQSLVGVTKELTTKFEKVDGTLKAVMTPIEEAGASAEQFRESMNLIKLVNSPNLADRQEALRILQENADALAQELGVAPAGVDPLTGFDDLIQAVNAKQITRQLAEETARGRRLAAAQTTQAQQQRTTQAQTQAQQQAVAQARGAVQQVEASYKAVDPAYEAKNALLKADQAFIAALRAAAPAQWATMYAQKYASIKLPPVVPTGTAPAARTPSPNQPMRGRSPAGTTATGPKSAYEALEAGMAGL